MSLDDVDVGCCRRRQGRLLEVMRRKDIDLVVVARPEHVEWLVGPRFGWVFEPAAALSVDGRALLAAPNQAPEVAAADEVVTYEAQWHSTLRNDQRAASSAQLAKVVDGWARPRRLGVEFSCLGRHLDLAEAVDLIDVEPELFYLRRHKQADELARIRKAIAATGAMYARAREIVEPGINELEVFSQLHAAAVASLGEPPSALLGNDFACGVRGGPPRDRRARDGELYILDLGPAYRGYFADNCRTLAVNGRPTDAQQAAWEAVVGVFAHVERFVRPGASARQLFHDVHAQLDGQAGGRFDHHLGHGIGLYPHEAPHLNPHWDDTFETGDVFTVEPGLYEVQLAGGIRLENNYLVTEDGVELLSDFPLQL